MLLHLEARDGRDGAPQPSEKQAEVFVNLGGCADGGSGVADAHLLLDGDGGRYALDVVALRLAYAPEELPGVSREALHIAALALGVERIESQRRLAAARQPSDDHEPVAGYSDIDILQVIDPCPFDEDAVCVPPFSLFLLSHGGCYAIVFTSLMIANLDSTSTP